MADQTITRETVVHVARLARLALDDDEIDRMTNELGDILRYVELLRELDTTHIEPTAQVGLVALPLREDVPCHGVDAAIALSQAPSTDHDGFAVPAFLDE